MVLRYAHRSGNACGGDPNADLNQVGVRGGPVACGGVLIRGPVLSWIGIVRRAVKDKFPGFWDF